MRKSTGIFCIFKILGTFLRKTSLPGIICPLLIDSKFSANINKFPNVYPKIDNFSGVMGTSATPAEPIK